MKVLVTNDDGIDAPGLHALARALVADGRDVVVVAPAHDMSGSGAAIGQVHLDQSIDARQVDLPGLDGVPAYALDGAPGLCVLAARLGGFGDPPDLVVSGINPGCNTGRAVLHSGTVGAALTGANFGVRGLAVSIDVVSRRFQEQGGSTTVTVAGGDSATMEVVDEGAPPPKGPCHWDTAARAAASAVDWLVAAPKGTVLNVNVPDRAPEMLAGARAATLAPFGTVRSTVVEAAHVRGRLQLEMRPTNVDLPPDCDTALVAAGYVAVSAITGVHIDDGVDVGGVLDAVVAEARASV
ncbi:MAG TPA: 5'/3'-nucleotidase SurE [Acidimicrobiales bacterium]|nr:5'/3'-nucleotidase SurE [Acidimicrobiales bacterium]